MGTSIFERDNEEEKIHKRAVLDENKKKKAYLGLIYSGLLIIGSVISVFISGGLILLIDGGITLTYIIVQISLSVYNKIIEKYLKNIPASKKRDFKTQIHEFYENIFINCRMTDNVDNNALKNFINQFIEEENILEKTSNKFEEKRNQIIDESNQSKKKFNILVIGPTGSGKSTLINEFFQIDEAEESYGDIGTLGFHPYTTDDSEYTLIDSQGLDYSKSLMEYSISLENYIIESNKTPNTFIDMIYYCTNNPTRLQQQEINLINKLEKIYDLEIVPLIIVHTQANSDDFHSLFINFVNDKYEGKYTVIKVLARKLDDKEATGLEDLKIATKIKKENNLESAYYCKFIANVSKNIYMDYKDNLLITTIKGFFINSKEESVEDMFYKIFNMYRFEKSNKMFNNEQLFTLNEFQKELIDNYKRDIDDFIQIVIRYNAESDAYYEKSKRMINEDQMAERIEELSDKKLNQFDEFKKDIDELLFPCLVDILKTKIITYFNQKVMLHLKPQIDRLMAH